MRVSYQPHEPPYYLRHSVITPRYVSIRWQKDGISWRASHIARHSSRSHSPRTCHRATTARPGSISSHEKSERLSLEQERNRKCDRVCSAAMTALSGATSASINVDVGMNVAVNGAPEARSWHVDGGVRLIPGRRIRPRGGTIWPHNTLAAPHVRRLNRLAGKDDDPRADRNTSSRPEEDTSLRRTAHRRPSGGPAGVPDRR